MFNIKKEQVILIMTDTRSCKRLLFQALSLIIKAIIILVIMPISALIDEQL